MKMYEYVMKGRITSWIPVILVITCCAIRLNAGMSDVGSVINYLDFFVYSYFPVVIWFYVQRIHRYYSSGFVHIRQNSNTNVFFVQTLIDYVTVVLFSLFITVIHMLIMMNSNVSLLEYPVLFAKLSAIYALLVSIFHVIYLIKHDIRIAFVISYGFLLFLSFSDTLFFLSIRIGSDTFQVLYILTCLLLSTITEVCILFYTKRKCDIYEIYS